MLTHWHPEKRGLDVWMDVAQIVPAHFGRTVAAVPALALLVSMIVLITTAIAAYRLVSADRRPESGWEERLVVAGWVVIVLGVVPFVRYFYAPIGLGDRVTVVSGVGGAMLLAGVVAVVGRWWRLGAGSFAVLLAVLAIAQRVSIVSDYAVAADDSRRILHAVEERWPSPPPYELVFGPGPINERNIVVFYEFTLPLRVLYGESVSARMTSSETEVPPRFQVDRRIDLRALSRLDDGRLGP